MSLKPFLSKLIVLAVGLAVVIALVISPARECASADGCGSGSQYCASGCCLGTTVVQSVVGCSPASWGCDWLWGAIYPVSCDGNCVKYYDQGKCAIPEGGLPASQCTGPQYFSARTNCCGSAPPTSPAPTTVPQPTRTPTPQITPTAIPILASLNPRYGSLVLNGPDLGLPAQTLNGLVSNGAPPYAITLFVRRPDNTTMSYSLSSSGSFSFNSTNAGDSYFGVRQEGTWQAWFTLTDSLGRGGASNTATWQVVFYPIHGAP